MEYKNAFFFVANCLLLKVTEAHKSELMIQIKSGTVNWGNVVRVASTHLVVPLLYVRLKDANLLSLLPDDLKVYLLEMYQLNSARNKLLLRRFNS